MLPLPPANPSDNSSQHSPQHSAATPSDVPQHGPVYSPPQTPPPSSNRNLWIILGSVLGGGCLLTVCGIIAMIGVLSILGRRVETTFDQINSGLEQQESSLSAPGQQVAKFEQAAASSEAFAPSELIALEVSLEEGDASVQPKFGYQFMVVTYRLSAPDEITYLKIQQDIDKNTIMRDAQGRGYDCCAVDFMKANGYDQVKYEPTGTDFRVAYEVPKTATELHLVQLDNVGRERSTVQVR